MLLLLNLIGDKLSVGCWIFYVISIFWGFRDEFWRKIWKGFVNWHVYGYCRNQGIYFITGENWIIFGGLSKTKNLIRFCQRLLIWFSINFDGKNHFWPKIVNLKLNPNLHHHSSFSYINQLIIISLQTLTPRFYPENNNTPPPISQHPHIMHTKASPGRRHYSLYYFDSSNWKCWAHIALYTK